MFNVVRLPALLVLALATIVAVACGGGDDKDKVTLALDWFPNANHTGLYLAMERGYFKDEGIALKVYTPDDPATILATVGSDKDEFGFEYQVGVLLARAQGVPVVSIAGIVQHPLNSVMALQESGITRPRDLVGRTVGYPGIATDPPLLRTMLEFDGVPPEQAQAVVDGMVNVGFDLIPALISRRVDAVVGAYWTHESISAQNQGFPVVVMRMEEWGVPDFYELVLVTSEDTLKKRPDVVQRFVRAVVRGYQDAAADPAAAVEVLLRRTGDEVDPAIERPGIKVIAPLWKNGVPVGWQTADRWREFAGWMNANGLLKNPVDGEKAFTNEFVELVD
jgi:putative hydroxymethylpyrimidine transport system substrate-binding protein